jgi:23S rRNA (adenine2030-N6)-methyltransferase
MLSYRHGFHAGNAADVLKHAVFVFVLGHLQRKTGPLLVLDTHAGAGLYDLASAEAAKTGEFRDGIGRLAAGAGDAPELLAGYLALVRARNPQGPLAVYPGSPALALSMKRPQDRLAFYELHPSDHQELAGLAAHWRGVSVERSDGFKGLLAQVPPAGRRGLALIDPSYEIKTDYDKVAAALAKAWRRFATGVYVLWYPVIERSRIDALLAAVTAAGIRKVYRIELGMAPDAPGYGMTASGVLVVNAPFTLPAAAETALPWLAGRLAARGPAVAEWLVPE